MLTGIDHLVGGSGDDVYKVHGGEAHIEDFQGHDTIDAGRGVDNAHERQRRLCRHLNIITSYQKPGRP